MEPVRQLVHRVRFLSCGRRLAVRGIIVDAVAERAALSLIHGHDNLGPDSAEWVLNEHPPAEFWGFIQRAAPDD